MASMLPSAGAIWLDFAEQAATPASRPTFDQWYSQRNSGLTFEDKFMQSGMPIDAAVYALLGLLRDYVSEMAR